MARATVPSQSPTWLRRRAALVHRHPASAPVVSTSSTNKTRRLSTWLPGRVAKAQRTDSQRSSRFSTCLSGAAARTHQKHRLMRQAQSPRQRLREQSWLIVSPLSRVSRSRCSGTGTTTSAAIALPSAFTISASRSANHAPSGSICSNFSSKNRPHHRVFVQRKLRALAKA